MRTSARDRAKNRVFRSQLRTALKDLRAEKDKEQAAAKFREASSLLDQAAASHLIHKKNASRNKSRLAQVVQKLG